MKKQTLITHLLVHFSLNVPKVFGSKNTYLNNDLVQGGNHGWGIQKDCLTPKSMSNTTLNVHYIYQIIYQLILYNSCDSHILLD